MKLTLLKINNYRSGQPTSNSVSFFVYLVAMLIPLFAFIGNKTKAQPVGAWTPLTNLSPDVNGGVMLLLSDGTVITKTFSGGADGIGNVWNKLTPDSHGSYINGTWSTIAAMHDTRLYFSSQILQDGRVYVAGGEYGTGGSLGEVYDPLTDVWTSAPAQGARISDANSEILPDGRVLQALVTGTLKKNDFYDPVTDTYTAAPNCNGIHNESAWLKLPDSSILFVDRLTKNSERYIPSLNSWIVDDMLPVDLYDPYGLETGAAFLLPDGRGFFLGSTGHTAYYTPSGSTTPGTWSAGPDIPNAQGTPDAAGAMMVDGKILCAVSPIPTSLNHFPSPTSYYEFNYKTNSFKRVHAPGGGLTTDVPCYVTNMLDLPNGQVLFCLQGSTQYYVYIPSGAPLNAGKPKINSVTLSGSSYIIKGKRFNGISEGAGYGDDWQMATNYPIVRLTSDDNVYYARTFDWNLTGVMTGSLACKAKFTLPAGLPFGTYSLEVTANGISSDPVSFTYGPEPIAKTTSQDINATVNDEDIIAINKFEAYPNPAKNQTTVFFNLPKASHISLQMFDMNGKVIKTLMNGNFQKGDHTMLLNTRQFSPGIYLIKMVTENGFRNIRLIVQ